MSDPKLEKAKADAAAAESEQLQAAQREAAKNFAKEDEKALKAGQDDKAKDELSAAKQGATAVAEAVKKVSDAVVAEVQKAPAKAVGGLLVSGVPGGQFEIRGDGFSSSGTVSFAGLQVETTGWSNERIKGFLPLGVKEGEVVVNVDGENQRRGYFKP